MPARKQADSTPPDEAEGDAAVTTPPEEVSAPASAPAQPPPPARPVPPYYIAMTALFVGGDHGTMPVRAFNAGQRVPADLVAVNGWSGGVRHPDDTDPAPAATQEEDHAVPAGQE